MTRPLNSSDWRIVSEHIDARIAELQRGLEKLDMDPVPTAVLRGRIAELRVLQSWGKTAIQQPVQP